MSYSTRAEVRDMVKDDALNAIIGDFVLGKIILRQKAKLLSTVLNWTLW